MTRRRRPDDQGHHAPGRRDRHLARDRGRHHRQPADRDRPRDDDRPHRARAELERAAAQGRLRARQRRDAQRPPRARPAGGVGAMRILGISGSLRGRLAQHAAPPGGGRPAAGGCRARAARPRRAARRSRPTTRTCASRRASRSRSPRCATAIEQRRRRAVRDAGVQPLAPGRPEERARLDLAADRREPAARARTSPSIGASTGMFGAVWAQAELRKVARRARRRACSTASCPSLAPTRRSTADGALASTDSPRSWRDQLGALAAAVAGVGAAAPRAAAGGLTAAAASALARRLLRVGADRDRRCRAPCAGCGSARRCARPGSPRPVEARSGRPT